MAGKYRSGINWLIANALGVATPRRWIEMGAATAVPVAAWFAPRSTRCASVAAGVDILVVQGTEAGGHCGEVSHGAVPKVIKAIKPIRDVPVLAAGGACNDRRRWRPAMRWARQRFGGSVWAGDPSNPKPPKSSAKKMIALSRRRGALQRAHRQAGAQFALGLGPMPGTASRQPPARCRLPLQSIISRDAFTR